MTDTPIHVAYPDADDLHLRIALGTCRFEARPGKTQAWIAGTCHDPTGNRTPKIIRAEERRVTITEEKPFFERIPTYFGGVPRYELEFGKEWPFSLTIETGASEFDLDLGGVPLKKLTVRQRAGRFNLNFSAPNLEFMSLLEVSSGEAGIALENLANANFSQMRLSGEAAGYELDFGGELKFNAEVRIETSLSGVDIAVPRTIAAKIVAETSLGTVDVGDGFTISEGAFLTERRMAGNRPLLTIHAEMRLGALQVRAT